MVIMTISKLDTKNFFLIIAQFRQSIKLLFIIHLFNWALLAMVRKDIAVNRKRYALKELSFDVE